MFKIWNKKVVISLAVVSLLAAGVAGGVFYWWRAGAELRELNKDLPEGVRVERVGKEYWVVNKIDGYEIKIPEEWGGLESIEYHIFEREENFLPSSSLSLVASFEEGLAGIELYRLQKEVDLETWTQEWFLEGLDFGKKWMEEGRAWIEKEKIENFEVVKIRIADMEDAFAFFFKTNLKIYRIGGASDKIIHKIILNSKW